MRVIIAGSRSMTDPKQIAAAIAQSGFAITEVMSGGARGVDTLGEAWARTPRIPVWRCLADWQRYGKSAGFRRNEAMAHVADALIIWDGSSPWDGPHDRHGTPARTAPVCLAATAGAGPPPTTS